MTTVLTGSLASDACTVLNESFRSTEVFACLTGSTLDGPAANPGSDIDLLIVLPDDVSLAQAVHGRTLFTRRYIDLHHAHNRTPDHDWPGEVLYLRDLHAALNGATFGPTPQEGAPPPLCSRDQPFRYWVSMIATGIPLTGAPQFQAYAAECAQLIARHATHSLRPCPAMSASMDAEQYWKTQWKLPVPRRSTPRTERIARYLNDQNPDNSESAFPAPPTHPHCAVPHLESLASRWTTIANQRHRHKLGRD